MNAYTNLAWKSKNLKTNTLILVLILQIFSIIKDFGKQQHFIDPYQRNECWWKTKLKNTKKELATSFNVYFNLTKDVDLKKKKSRYEEFRFSNFNWVISKS